MRQGGVRRTRKRLREASITPVEKPEEPPIVLGRAEPLTTAEEGTTQSNPLEVVPLSTLPGRIRAIDVVAEGGFGCILRGYQESHANAWGLEFGATDAQRQRAIKIQAIDDKMLEEVARKEALVSLQVSRVVEDRQAPGVTQFFDAFVSEGVPVAWANLVGEKCSNFHRKHLKLETVTVQSRGKRRVTQKTKGGGFLFTVTEFADSGNLDDYVRSRIRLDTPFRVSELSNIAFQICWSLFVLQSRFGFRHFDIKMLNMVLKRVTESRMYHFKTRDERWIYGIGATGAEAPYDDLMSFPFEVKLVDFGFGELLRTPLLEFSGSESMSSLRGTLDIFEPEVFFDIPHVGRRGFDADVWAAGIILLELGLTGWLRPPEITHIRWRSGTSLDITRLHVFSLYQEAGDANAIKARKQLATRVRSNITKMASRNAAFRKATRPSTVLQYIENRAEFFDVLFGICLFQHAAGHGLLPSLDDWPELRDNPIYVGIDMSRDILLAMGEVEYYNSCSKRTETKQLYTFTLERVQSRYGDEGIDLILRMLSWSRRGRQTLGMPGASPDLFHHCIMHDFFLANRESVMTAEIEKAISKKNTSKCPTIETQFHYLPYDPSPTSAPGWFKTLFGPATVRAGVEVLYESPWTYIGPTSPMTSSSTDGTTTARESMNYSATIEPASEIRDTVDATFMDVEQDVEMRASRFLDAVQTEESVIFLSKDNILNKQLSRVGDDITSSAEAVMNSDATIVEACDYCTPVYMPIQ